MAELRLRGCRSRPLLGYLKALGLLRVVAHQADSGARGRWSNGAFELSSTFEESDLEEFFLDRYAPTPVVSPWNGGSGFFPGDYHKALEALEHSDLPRLSAFRGSIAAARQTLDQLSIRKKPEPKHEKPALLRALRRQLPDSALEWLDAAVVLVGGELQFPPLLGSGGNDGRYDFANNYAQALVQALALGVAPASRDSTEQWLRSALHAAPAELVRKLSGAHFQRDSSPTNSPLGESDALGNPWDLVLAVEGSLLLAAGAARRHASSLSGALAAPFTARSTSAGFSSAVAGEKGRAELWLPLWPGWASLPELQTLTREARAQVGRRQASDGLDFARAAGELGVGRGITAFERYAIVERAGQSSLAVSAGRIDVHPRPAVAALQSIDRWLHRVKAYGRSEASAAIRAGTRRLEQALFAFAEEGSPGKACHVLELIGELESLLAVASPPRGSPIAPVSGVPAETWLDAADDGSDEFALAASLASLRDSQGTEALPAIRDYLHGTRRDSDRGRRYGGGEKALLPRRMPPTKRLARLHARRHVDAGGAARPLVFDRGMSCPVWVVARFAEGMVDTQRIVRLTEGLALLNFGQARLWMRRDDTESGPISPVFAVLALAWAGTAEHSLSPRPGWVAKLAAGRVGDVVGDGLRRLRMGELPPLLDEQDLSIDEVSGEALAAALLIPLSRFDRDRLARLLVDKATATDQAEEDTPTQGAPT